MEITRTQNGDKETLNLSGRLDTTTAPALQEVLVPLFDTMKQVELNFSGINYVSSAGLRVLLVGEKTARAKGGTLTLVNVSPEVMEVFEMTGFSTMLHIQ